MRKLGGIAKRFENNQYNKGLKMRKILTIVAITGILTTNIQARNLTPETSKAILSYCKNLSGLSGQFILAKVFKQSKYSQKRIILKNRPGQATNDMLEVLDRAWMVDMTGDKEGDSKKIGELMDGIYADCVRKGYRSVLDAE